MYAIGERLIIRYPILPVGPAGPLFILFRAEVIGSYVDGGIEYFSMRRDDGDQTAFPDNPGLLFREGALIPIVSGNTPAEFQTNAQNSSFTLKSGDVGQVIIDGFGLGALALVPGVRTAFANQFIVQGMVLAGITGDGFNKFVVHWEIPEFIAPVGYHAGPQAVIVIPVIVIAAIIVIGIAALGWSAPRIFLSIKSTPGSPAKPAIPVQPGQPGLVGRIMVRKSDGSLVPPGQNNIPLCDDPLGCTLLYEPAIEGTKGILGELQPLIWIGSLALGGMVLSNLLQSLPRKGNER